MWDFSDEDPRFDYTMVCLVGREEVRSLRIGKRQHKISSADIHWMQAQIIPPEALWPLAPSHFRRFSTELGPDIYVKPPDVSLYSTLQSLGNAPAELLLQEATIFETVLREPHPNITKYLGCLVGQDGRIRGLCFRKYQETVHDRLRDPCRPIDLQRQFQNVEDGVKTLRSLGIVHNDLHSGNIMLDEEDNTFINDFDSCRPRGDPLGPKPGIDPTKTLSEYENDEEALESLRKEWHLPAPPKSRVEIKLDVLPPICCL